MTKPEANCFGFLVSKDTLLGDVDVIIVDVTLLVKFRSSPVFVRNTSVPEIMQEISPKRVIAYIDGFNLYHGIKSKCEPADPYEKPWRNYYWLDPCQMVSLLLQQDQTLEFVKYFTARVTGNSAKVKRQSDFLDAISLLPKIKIIEGRYEPTQVTCRGCYRAMSLPNEKMTDVNIAVEMIKDAYCNAFDVALLVSGDSDLTAPVRAIRQLFPDKMVILVFPPNRFSNHLSQPDLATACLRIRERELRKSQLPPSITMPNGYELTNPWVVK